MDSTCMETIIHRLPWLCRARRCSYSANICNVSDREGASVPEARRVHGHVLEPPDKRAKLISRVLP